MQPIPERGGSGHAANRRGRLSRFAHPIHTHLQHPIRQRPPKGVGCLDGQERSLVEQRHPIETLRLVHVGRTHDHRHAPRHHLVHDEPEIASGDRIHTEGGFVEEEDGRFVDERAGQTELLFHAPRKPTCQAVLERSEVRESEETLHALLECLLRNLVERRVKRDVLAYGEVGIQTEALRHVSEVVLDRFGIGGHAHAVQVRVARAGTEHAREHAQRRRLSGSIGTDETEQLPARHGEIEAAHRREASEVPAQPLHAYGDVGHEPDSSRRTSAGMPGLSARSVSFEIRTFAMYTSFTRSSVVWTFLGVNSASLAMKVTCPE